MNRPNKETANGATGSHVIAALPIKPFGIAKKRLSPILGPGARSQLGRAIAARTASLCAEAGADVHIITSDDGVAAWAKEHDLAVIREDPSLGNGLDGAALAAARHAAQLHVPWVIVHADLPVAKAADLRGVFEAATAGPVIAPSYDGGTNLISGSEPRFAFSYGPGSFHRHLAQAPHATVIVAPRLALDLDTPQDLARATASTAGAWLGNVLGTEYQAPGT
jgi:2-phospho-L-lactate guanylyltransferase